MAMRVWLYARLSNDDDPAQNSLQNQQEICRAFAEKQGWTIAGSSADDNISGMNFSRRGLDIYALYLQGCGQKEIARRLNSLGCKTPAQVMTERIGYDSQKPHKTRDGQFLWTYASVKNVLVEEAYTGVLVNHRREYLGGKARAVSEADWLRHENFYPVIIEKAIWQQVQTLLKQQARPAVNNRTKHRYAGLLTCQECGNSFSPMIRYWNGSRRVEYVCRGYQRNGRGYCTSHRIHEEVLDKAVWDDTEKMREQYAAELKKVTQLQKQWALRKPVLDAHCFCRKKSCDWSRRLTNW